MQQSMTPQQSRQTASSSRSVFREWMPSMDLVRTIAVFAGRRLLFGAAVLLAIIFLTNFGLTLVQGVEFPPAMLQAFHETWVYLAHLAHGDLGVTLPGTILFRIAPVTEILGQIVSRSLGLLGTTFLVSIVIGVTVGGVAAMRRKSKFSMLLVLGSLIGISTPSFFAALFLQIAAIWYTRGFGHSIVPVGGFGWDKHIILPMLVLAARPVAQITRITYVSLTEIFDQDYVRTAHSKGLRSDHVFFAHIVRNAMVPILTTIAVSLRFSLSSLPVVEVYFGWGGMGQTLLASIFNQDKDLTIALFLTLGMLFILVNLILEASYYVIDPRLRVRDRSANRRDEGGVIGALGSVLAGLHSLILDNAVVQWLLSRASARQVEESPYRHILEKNGRARTSEEKPVGDQSHWRAWRKGILGNLPLLTGIIMVGFLLFLTIYGPRLAPFSPNTTQQIARIDGVLTTPPFPPSETYIWGTDPLGRDMYSLILAGAQQTVILALVVVAARMLIGFILGVLAGWFHDTWVDRLITGLVQAIAVYPTLLLAALLIFIIGIQNGIRTFVIALSLVGWGEIMQFVRGEVINIRPKPFIESAIAIGQRTLRLILMHVLPNLAPKLISVAALEVGAVLLLLGELGFLGIFIRGGAGTDFGLYSQVPEWGALLSGVRTWTRSYPWTGFFPTVAFFIAVLGFNLLGEGLRRFLDEVGLVINRLFNRYTFGALILGVFVFMWARNNTGELVFFRQQAESLDGERVMQHVEKLTAEEMQGRALGSQGLTRAAEYIGDQFKRLGLQSAGDNMSYFQQDMRSYMLFDGVPGFTIDDDGAEPVFLEDFTVYPGESINTGSASGMVRFLAAGSPAGVPDLDFSEDIIMISDESLLPELQNHACRGVLMIARDLSFIKRAYTYSPTPAGSGCGADGPVLWISDRLANRIIKPLGKTMQTLEEEVDALQDDARLNLETDTQVSIAIDGHVEADVPVVNVIGHLPGTSADLDSQLVIVAAQYDSPPIGPGGVYPGANDNASAIAGMLEIIRTMQESGYQPFKTFLFVAYSGEGLPDLNNAPAVRSFLRSRTGFDTAYDIEAVIYMRGLGIGQEVTLGIWTQSAPGLAKLLESASHLTGMETERVNDDPSMNIYNPGSQPDANIGLPLVGIGRFGWERSARLATDTVTFMRADDLEDASEAVTLGLMVIGRE